MTKKEKLIEELKKLHKSEDKEIAHVDANNLLLDYIGDVEVTEAFELVPKWYA